MPLALGLVPPWIGLGHAGIRRAAQFYRDVSHEKMPLHDHTQIPTASAYFFGRTPHSFGAVMTMLYKAAIIKTKPQSWTDMYFPEAQQLAGD